MKSLQEHVRTCQQQRQEKTQKVAEGREQMCEFCSKMFCKMSDLRRHIRRSHQFVPETPSEPSVTTSVMKCVLPVTSSGEELGSVVSMDELGSDPEIELVADEPASEALSTPADDIATIRKPTRPVPVVCGKKPRLSLVSFTGQSFDFGEKIVTSDVETSASVRSPVIQTEILPEFTSDTYIRHVICTRPTVTVTTATASFNVREYGVQCNMERSRVEHHRIIETTKVYKENGADVTRKEVHETRWVE